MAIYVGNLSYSATEADVTAVFAEYGKVESVQMPVDRETGRVRGFGFVNMASEAEEQAAIDALDGSEWMGRTLRVNKAKPREKRQNNRREGSWDRNRAGSVGRSDGFSSDRW